MTIEKNLNNRDIYEIILAGLGGVYRRSNQLFYFKRNYNGENDGEWADFEQLKSFLTPHIDKLFFEPIEKIHPELSNLRNDFWDKFKNKQNLISVISSIYADKIETIDLHKLIFSEQNDHSDIARREFLLKYINKEPFLINELKDYILNKHDPSGVVKNISIRGELMAFIELLPKQYNNIEDISNIDKVVKCLKTTKLAAGSNLKALNSLIKYYPKDKEAIDFIQDIFSDSLEQQHNLRTALNKYKNKILGTVEKEKYTLSINESFNATVNLPDKVLFDNFNVSQSDLILIKAGVSDFLSVILQSKLENKPTVYIHTGEKGDKNIHIEAKSIEDHILAKETILKLQPEIELLITLLNKNTKEKSLKDSIDSMDNIVQRVANKHILETELNTEKIVSKKKMKI